MYTIIRSRVDFTAFDKHGNQVSDTGSLPQIILDSFNARKRTTISAFNMMGNLNRGYAYNPEGVVLPEPESVVILDNEDRKAPSNPSYKRRMRSGEIVVSSMHARRFKVTRKSGVVAGKNVYVGTVATQDRDQYSGDGFILENLIKFTPCPWNPSKRLPYDGNRWYWINIVFWYTDSLSQAIPPALNFDDLYPSLSNSYDSVLLQEVTSTVYSRSVDALTAMAEGPETVASVWGVLKNIPYLVLNYKKILKSLAERFVRNKRLIHEAFQKELSVIDSLPRKTKKQNEYINRRTNRARSLLAKKLKRETFDNTSRIASAWLTFRYEIMPNVYLVQDLIEANKNLGKPFIKEHKTRQYSLDLPQISGASVSGTFVSRQTAWCGARLRVYSPLDELTGVASFNMLVTAWELVPLSFVIDWFLNVGDALSVLSPPQGVQSQGITFATKHISHLEIVYPDSSGYTVEMQDYYRQVLSTTDFVGINFNVQINWQRVLDAGALLWSISLRKRLNS